MEITEAEILLLGIYTKELKTESSKYMYTFVYRSNALNIYGS